MPTRDVLRRLKRGPDAWFANGRHGRSAVVWLIVLFTSSQVVAAVALERGVPQWRDPECYQKLDRLTGRQGERPGSPTIVALGSSRVYMGLRPAALERPDTPNDRPILFNAALIGAGPVLQQLALERLLREGQRPDAVIVEFWPVYLLDRTDDREENRIDPNRLSFADLDLVTRHADDPLRFQREWRTARIVPSLAHRFVTRSLVVRTWDPFNSRIDHNWRPVDDWGWKPGQATGGDAAIRAGSVRAVRPYYTKALSVTQYRPRAVAAMEDLFDCCARHGLPAAIVWMPESSEFRAWYAPAVESGAAALLERWQRQRGLTLIDARAWLPDSDLSDGFHLTPTGATVFTERFAAITFAQWAGWRVPALRAE